MNSKKKTKKQKFINEVSYDIVGVLMNTDTLHTTPTDFKDLSQMFLLSVPG